jgi:hypothetical protein
MKKNEQLKIRSSWMSLYKYLCISNFSAIVFHLFMLELYVSCCFDYFVAQSTEKHRFYLDSQFFTKNFEAQTAYLVHLGISQGYIC